MHVRAIDFVRLNVSLWERRSKAHPQEERVVIAAKLSPLQKPVSRYVFY